MSLSFPLSKLPLIVLFQSRSSKSTTNELKKRFQIAVKSFNVGGGSEMLASSRHEFRGVQHELDVVAPMLKHMAYDAKEMLKELVGHLEKNLDKELLNKAGFRIHISGCPNNCCPSLVAEIGLEGRLIRKNDEMKQHYDILLGGGLGQKSSLGRLIEERVPADEVKFKIEALLTNYWRKRKPSEGLREFCNRHTTEELKSYLNSTGG